MSLVGYATSILFGWMFVSTVFDPDLRRFVSGNPASVRMFLLMPVFIFVTIAWGICWLFASREFWRRRWKAAWIFAGAGLIAAIVFAVISEFGPPATARSRAIAAL